MDIRRHKPLWGIGPIGWIALAILTAFVVAVARGWDLVHACAALIWHCSSGTLESWVKIWVVVWCFPAVMMSGVTLGVWGLLYASIAFFVYPRRLPCLPIALLFATVAVEAFAFGLSTVMVKGRVPPATPMVLASAAAVIEFGLLLWITRRWWCAAPLAIPLLWNAAVEPVLGNSAYPAWFGRGYVIVCTHIVIAVPLLLWAIAARIKPAPPGKPCPTCEYDLTGLSESSPCPECGLAAATH